MDSDPDRRRVRRLMRLSEASLWLLLLTLVLPVVVGVVVFVWVLVALT